MEEVTVLNSICYFSSRFQRVGASLKWIGEKLQIYVGTLSLVLFFAHCLQIIAASKLIASWSDGAFNDDHCGHS